MNDAASDAAPRNTGDGRSTLLSITDRGRTMVEKIFLSMKDMEHAVLYPTDKSDQVQLNRLLRNILKDLS